MHQHTNFTRGERLKSNKTYQNSVYFQLCREELELANKRLLEETTKNFKRLESDVQRVERILEEKETNITDLQQETKVLTQSLRQAKEENQLLIEALLSKDLIIKEFQAKISELLE